MNIIRRGLNYKIRDDLKTYIISHYKAKKGFIDSLDQVAQKLTAQIVRQPKSVSSHMTDISGIKT